MLNGVEILSQEVINTAKCNYSILVIGIITSILLGIFFSCLINLYFGQVIVFLGLFMSCILTLIFPKSTEEYTRYKVTISDTVNFVEFNEKYEVLEQDGKIYTIKERIDE